MLISDPRNHKLPVASGCFREAAPSGRVALPAWLWPSRSFRQRLPSWTANCAFAMPAGDPISLPFTLKCGGTGLTCRGWHSMRSTCCFKTVSICADVIHRPPARFAPAVRQPARALPLPGGDLPGDPCSNGAPPIGLRASSRSDGVPATVVDPGVMDQDQVSELEARKRRAASSF